MLEDLRVEIDRLDDELLALLNKRVDLSMKAADFKKELNLPCFLPQREASILKRLEGENKGPLTRSGLHAIFGELFIQSRDLQEKQEVSFMLDAKEFAFKLFGVQEGLKAYDEYYKIFADLKEGRSKYALLKLVLNDDLFFAINHFKQFIYAKFEYKNHFYLVFSKHKNRQSTAKTQAFLLDNSWQLNEEILQNEKIFCIKGEKFSYIEADEMPKSGGLWLGAFEMYKRA